MAEEQGLHVVRALERRDCAYLPQNPEGQAAPLKRYDIHASIPENVALETRVRFTPTFILVQNGAEIGRIEGYPGEEFFWGLLGQLLERARVQAEDAG